MNQLLISPADLLSLTTQLTRTASPCATYPMFQDVLRDMVEGVEGGVGALLMGFDGIAVDQYLRADDNGTVETLGLEFSVILKTIRAASESIEVGDTEEVVVRANHLTAILRLLNQEYFVALAVKPTSNTGKARYLARIAAPKLIDALG